MVKKILFVSLVLSGFLFVLLAGDCFADVEAELQQAEKYIKQKMYGKAENIYKTIIENYPGTDDALKAQQKLINLYIQADRNSEAWLSLRRLSEDFSENANLPEALWDIVRRFRWSRKYEHARVLCEQIIEQHPDSSYANRAPLEIAKLNVYSLIGSEEYEAAGAAVDTLVGDFNDHTYLSASLYGIAVKYVEARRYEAANSVYERIIQRFPDGADAGRSLMDISRIDILADIDSDGNGVPEEAIDRLIADFNGHSDLFSALECILRRQEKAGKYEDTKNVYVKIVQLFPNSLYAEREALDMQRLDIFPLIDSGEYTAAKTATDALIADFNEHSHLPVIVSLIAEHYYYKGIAIEKEGTAEQAQSMFEKTIELLETIINKFHDSAEAAGACYWAGDCYHFKLGEYDKGLVLYEKMVRDWPEHRYAWHGQFMIGRSYEKAEESELMPESEADPLIAAAYEKVVAKYPTCPAMKHAYRWLKSHNYR